MPLDQEIQATVLVHTVLQDLVEDIRASFEVLITQVLFCCLKWLRRGSVQGWWSVRDPVSVNAFHLLPSLDHECSLVIRDYAIGSKCVVPKFGSLCRAVSRVKVNVPTSTNVPIAWADSLVKFVLVPGLSLEPLTG